MSNSMLFKITSRK